MNHGVLDERHKRNRTRRASLAFLFSLLLALAVPALGLLTASSAAADTVRSVASGNWSDPGVWSLRRVPRTGDEVSIGRGTTVTYDVSSDAVIGSVEIEGTLRVSREHSTRLKLSGNLMVHQGGTLDMGTAASPIPRNIRHELVFVLPRDVRFKGGPEFAEGDTGLWVMHGGRWESHGAPLVRTWSKLAQDAQAGATSVVVENNVADWYVGGTVVVTSSTMPRAYRVVDGKEKNADSDELWQEEVRTIKALEAISGGKTRISLDAPLRYFHSGTAPMRAEVGLLTRNVLVTTELQGVSASELASDWSKRRFAHTMFMHGSSGNVMYTEFRYMGHYGAMARYPVHMHMMRESSLGMVVRGNAIWLSGFRWIVTHETYDVLVEDNVGFDSVSSGFYVERSPETERSEDGPIGNVLVHNLGVRLHKPDTEVGRDEGIFWLDQLDQVLLGNVGTGAGIESTGVGDRAAAFRTEREDGTGNIRPMVFVKNEGHSNYAAGIRTWSNNIPDIDMVDNLFWRNGYAGIIWGAYNGTYRYHHTSLIQNGRFGVETLSTESFLQDSLVQGGSHSSALEDVGFHVGSYTNAAQPDKPLRLIRTVFKDHETFDLRQQQRECRESMFEDRPIVGGEGCSTVYVDVRGSQFLSDHPLYFGWTPNSNSFWRFFDYTGKGDLPHDFVLLRKDQEDPRHRAIISQRLVTGKSYYSSQVDALVTPLDSLPANGIQFNDLQPMRDREEPVDYTFATSPDYPPQVGLSVSMSGKKATLEATVSDDKSIARVEFYVDENRVAEKTSGPYTYTVDLSRHARKYAYLYVKAYDKAGQYAYSTVTELGPEAIQDGQPQQPAPTPSPTPTATATPPHQHPTATPTPRPTATPTPRPTSTPTPRPTATATPRPESPSISIQGVSLMAGETAEAKLVISAAPSGVAGYDIEVALESADVAQVVDVEFPDLGLTEHELVSGSRVRLKAVDTRKRLQPGQTGATIATIVFKGVREGTTRANINVRMIDDDSGNRFSPQTTSASVTVTGMHCPLLPGLDSPSRDLDSDGLCEDVNGNGRSDFADLVELFTDWETPAVQGHTAAFDFNGNGRLDLADMVALFERLLDI